MALGPFGSLWVPLGALWLPLGCPWAPFGSLWGGLGPLWGAIGLRLGRPGLPNLSGVVVLPPREQTYGTRIIKCKRGPPGPDEINREQLHMRHGHH